MQPVDAQGLEVYVQQPERRLGLMARLLGHAAHHHLRGAGLLSFLHSQLASSYGAWAEQVSCSCGAQQLVWHAVICSQLCIAVKHLALWLADDVI